MLRKRKPGRPIRADYTGLIADPASAGGPPSSSYTPVDIKEPFEVTVARMEAAKPRLAKRQMALLNERYDLADRPPRA